MVNTGNKPKYIAVAELAKMLDISRVAVFNKIKKGQIPAEKIGRAYAIPYEHVVGITLNKDMGVLTKGRQDEIERAVAKVVKEYGETLRLLGQE